MVRSSPLSRILLRLVPGVALLMALSSCGGGGGGSGPAAPPPPPTQVNIAHARAAWLDHATIAWPGTSAAASFRLYFSASGGMSLDTTGKVTGADGFYDLSVANPLPSPLAARFPLWAAATTLLLPAGAQAAEASLFKGEILVVDVDAASGVQGTHAQLQGVLDDVYAAAAAPLPLGPTFAADGTPTFRLWAPTARSVSVSIAGVDTPMVADAASGTWSSAVTGAAGAYYTFKVQVYSRTDGGTVRNYVVSDPYATSLDAAVAGGPVQQAMALDLSSAASMPAGWATDTAPPQVSLADTVLYELHVRDFSDNDPSLANPASAGKFSAFADPASLGMQHLAAMAAAGLTHVHLLPSFDFASVSDSGCTTPVIAAAGPVSQVPQATVTATAATDCYNWGYDPRHYGAPEGSYASNAADGSVRVREMRSMVAGLHGAGLRVVMDVVYNHTSGNFLDQIVPGYYYRLDANGALENYSCCTDTATEFAMASRLMSDTLVRWAVQYHVDGFRFDIMSFSPRAAILAARTAVDTAVAAAGRTPLYYYGEGWNAGGADVAGDARFVMARQANLAGTGIGSFNDRLRDAVRGGGPFDTGSADVANQGFASGLCYDPNALSTCPPGEPSHSQDLIRIGMAGGLAAFPLASGVPASSILYGGQPAGYTGSPIESVNYVASHDNETLWDIAQYKHPGSTTSADRARAQVVALSTILLGQGIPFVHGGDEILRSKAMDRNSYDSGDWFNRIDWSASTNYFNAFGLPPAPANQPDWVVMTPILQNPLANPSPADILWAREAVKDLLRVRRSTTMFRLGTAPAVISCVAFPDEGSQRTGAIVMTIGAPGGGTNCGDNHFKSIVVLVNAATSTLSYALPSYLGHSSVTLHPTQAAGSDSIVKQSAFQSATGIFTVPARTAAVFVEP